MSLHRFYIPELSTRSTSVTIRGEKAHQITRVLRKRAGDQIICFDGSGPDYLVSIRVVNRDEVLGEIVKRTENCAGPRRKVYLYQSLLKGDRFDFVIQKATELGVSRIIPVVTERTIVRLSEKREKQRLERWNRIAVEAAEQCGRPDVPEVTDIVELKTAVKEAFSGGVFLFAYEGEQERGIDSTINWNSTDEVRLLIGPEGGFGEREARLAREAGLLPVSLGPRILRAETAALVLLTMVMDRMGEFNAEG